MRTEELLSVTDSALLCPITGRTQLQHAAQCAFPLCRCSSAACSTTAPCKAHLQRLHKLLLCVQLGFCFLQLFEGSVFCLSADLVCVSFPNNSSNRSQAFGCLFLQLKGIHFLESAALCETQQPCRPALCRWWPCVRCWAGAAGVRLVHSALACGILCTCVSDGIFLFIQKAKFLIKISHQ